jgi:hypothetical protein
MRDGDVAVEEAMIVEVANEGHAKYLGPRDRLGLGLQNMRMEGDRICLRQRRASEISGPMSSG